MTLPPGIHKVKKRQPDGSEKIYYYDRATRAPLPDPSAPEFEAAREEAKHAYSRPPDANTFGALLLEYRRSPGYRDRQPHTKKAYERAINRLRKFHDSPVEDIKRGDIVIMRNALAMHSKQAANQLVMVLGVLMQFAIDIGWRDTNPCTRMKRLAGGHYKRWPDAAIQYALDNFEEPFRRAIILALYTGQREGDCCAMTWAQFDGSGVEVTQQKTGAHLWIPAHKVLKQELARWRLDTPGETILKTSTGRPWKQGSFAVMFCVAMAAHPALEGLVFHGLRKAAAARLAEAGCSTHDIAAITGHASLDQIELYTKEANQRLRAKRAMKKLEGNAPVYRLIPGSKS